MKVSAVSNAFERYIGGLGGPSTDAGGEPQYSVSVPPPPQRAEAVAAVLTGFVKAVVEATNERFRNASVVVASSGQRDGAFAIPGGLPRIRSATPAPPPLVDLEGDLDSAGLDDRMHLSRPPFVSQIIDSGVAAMSNAHTLAHTYLGQLQMVASESKNASQVSVNDHRRSLHWHQRGLMLVISTVLVAAFGTIASRLNDWPWTSQGLDGSSRPGATTGPYLVVATLLIVAIGITAGFYAANRERAVNKVQQRTDRAEGIRYTISPESDRLMLRLWEAGLILSVLIAGLVGVAGWFRLDDPVLGRMIAGVLLWMIWGAAGFAASAYLARVSQHWLNSLPAEIDLVDRDLSSAEQNGISAEIGIEYITFVLRDQHNFVVDFTSGLVDRYYEANLLRRNSSRDAELDAFFVEDARLARMELESAALERLSHVGVAG